VGTHLQTTLESHFVFHQTVPQTRRLAGSLRWEACYLCIHMVSRHEKESTWAVHEQVMQKKQLWEDEEGVYSRISSLKAYF
jgi:hypothetical protein